MKKNRVIAAFLALVMLFTIAPTASAKENSKGSESSWKQSSWSQSKESADKKKGASEENEAEKSEAEEVQGEEMEIPADGSVSTENIPSAPAQDFSGDANGVTVTVNAPEGAFPADTAMSVSEANASAVQAAADAVNADASDVKAVDITFTADGEEIEPAAPISVTLESELVASAEEAVVVHVDDKAQAEVVTDTTVEGEAVSFEADAFTVYAIVATSSTGAGEPEVNVLSEDEEESSSGITNYTVVINYVFEDGTQAAQSWSAFLQEGSDYTSNTIAYPSIVGYEPIVPTVPSGVTADENGITFNLTAIDGEIEITVIYKPAEVDYTVNYYQQNVDDDNYTLYETAIKTGLTGSQIGVTYNSEKDRYEGFYGLLFDDSITIAADGSTEVEIYYDRNYYLMTFDLDGGYGVEPIYARYGATISVGDPTRAGYAFADWNEEIPATMPAKNTRYTAQWEAANATYTIAYWLENPNDDGYSYLGSATGSANTGDTVSGSDTAVANDIISSEAAQYYTYNDEKTDTNVTVNGDGSSVVNVYYDRNEYTLYFYYQRLHVTTTNPGRPNQGGGSTTTYQIASYTDGYTNSETGTLADASWVNISDSVIVKEEYRDIADSKVIDGDTYYYLTLTVKYGQNLTSIWPTAPFEDADGYKFISWGTQYGSGYNSANSNNNIKGPYSIMDESMIVSGSTEHDMLAYWNSSPTMYTYEIYYSLLDGETSDRTYESGSYTLQASYTVGSTAIPSQQSALTFEGVTYVGMDYDGTNSGYDGMAIRFYYQRNLHSIAFNDQYGITSTVTDIPYGQNISSYADTEPNYPDTLEAGAYTFSGWYLDPTCTTEADFDITMPDNNLVFYAKWVPVTHTVKTYMDSTLSVQIGDAQEVSHGSFAEEPEEPKNGNYTFVGWFYMDNGVEKAFDFNSMPVRSDLDIYAKWSSNVLVAYTINYQLEDGIVIAAPTTGSALAGNTKTFDAKVGDQLYEGYQTGYFPVVSSHSLLMDINGGDNNVYTFIYKPADNVPYTVKYVDAETGEEIADAKVVNENTYSVVTETAVTVSGYLPDAFQKRLILTLPESGAPTANDNVLIFYYTKDNEHAIVSTSHYLVDGNITTQFQHSEETGTIGQTYTREALTISGYSLDHVTINDVTWDGEGDPSAVLTGEGLNFEFYYTPNYFYVYHSSDQSVETIFVPEDGTFNITALVKDGYLYGGYYKNYLKAGTYVGGAIATYDGTNYTGAMTGYWDGDDAYTTNGTTMIPVVGKTYYLKEVPEAYFQPYMAVVYDSYADPNVAKALYLISATDDKNYQAFGLVAIDSITQEQEFTSYFTFQQKLNVGAVTIVTAKTAFDVPGYLGVWNATDELEENNDFTYRPYVMTPDGVTVYGTTIRTVYTGDVTYNGTLDKFLDDDMTVENPGVYKVDEAA